MDDKNPYHYDLIKRAIDFIEETRPAQPSLAEIAQAAGLSQAHFQRVFTKWAGISPTKYQQYLTLIHAKTMLENKTTLMHTALNAGLSGSGRLHDLFVNWESMSPGDYAKKGAGLVIDYGWTESPFGTTLIMATPRGICAVGFAGVCGRAAALDDFIGRWPCAEFHENPTRITPLAQTIFNSPAQTTPINLHLIGAPFHIKVWEALLTIPPGARASYTTIAESIDHPRAVRAVGTAIGRNPISWLIPCHRALRKSGGLGGYHWGLPIKRAMMAWEAAQDTGKN